MAKDTIINKRLYAYSIQLFSKLAKQKGILVVCTSFSSGIDLNKPIMDEVNRYYGVQAIQVTNKGKIQFNQSSGNT